MGKGDVVACCSATIPEMAIALYGLNKLGASMLTLDPRRSVPEIRSFLSAARVKVLLLLDLAFEHTAKLVSELDFIGTVVIISVDNYMPFLVRKLKALTMPPPSIRKKLRDMEAEAKRRNDARRQQTRFCSHDYDRGR